jgi:hypothetical protein
MEDGGVLFALFVLSLIALVIFLIWCMCGCPMPEEGPKHKDVEWSKMLAERHAYNKQLDKKRNVCIEFIGKYEVEENGKLYLINAGNTKTDFVSLIACGSEEEAVLLSRNKTVVCLYRYIEIEVVKVPEIFAPDYIDKPEIIWRNWKEEV